jgi:hypothetical protein
MGSVARRARALAVALAACPAAVAAQTPVAGTSAPRTTVSVSLGGGRTLEPTSFTRDIAAIVGMLGARRQLWGALMVEGGVQYQAAFATGSDLSLVCVPVAPGSDQCRVRGIGDRVLDAGGFTSLLARVGVERRLGARGPSVRLAAGGGHMTEIGEPFASLAGGASLGGGTMRLVVDVDRWWSRVDVTELTLSLRDPNVRGERTLRERATSTFVRVGLELPLAGR